MSHFDDALNNDKVVSHYRKRLEEEIEAFRQSTEGIRAIKADEEEKRIQEQRESKILKAMGDNLGEDQTEDFDKAMDKAMNTGAFAYLEYKTNFPNTIL